MTVRLEMNRIPSQAAQGALVSKKDNVFTFPGFCDVHVHFREPGFSYKETMVTGSRSAARGGYTAVCAMPNLKPVPDSIAHLEEEETLIRAAGGIVDLFRAFIGFFVFNLPGSRIGIVIIRNSPRISRINIVCVRNRATIPCISAVRVCDGVARVRFILLFLVTATGEHENKKNY